MTKQRTQDLPWANLPCKRIKMTKNDVWAFGPTILKKDTEYVLPEDVCIDFVGRSSAIYIEKK